MDTLMQLPLSVQSQFLLLRASLQARMAHLMLTAPRELESERERERSFVDIAVQPHLGESNEPDDRPSEF